MTAKTINFRDLPPDERKELLAALESDIDDPIERHLSVNEAGTILALKKLSETWPDRYWMWAADGKLYLMAKDANGNRAMTSSGSVDPSYMVRALNIPADGGDW